MGGDLLYELGKEDKEYIELLEKSIQPLEEGKIVKGVITKIRDNFVYIDVGLKCEALAYVHEFKPEELIEGNTVYVYVENPEGRDGRPEVSKHKADFVRVWEQIRDMYERNETASAVVKKVVKGGVMVDLMGVEAFLPSSQFDVKKVKSLSQWVGKSINVKIIKLNYQRKNIIVSRKEVLEEELESQRMEIAKLKSGDVVEGVVKNITNFGVFVSLGKIDGLIHISDLSWTRVQDPHEVVKVGDKITVKVLEVDPQNLKVSLSRKHLLPHPWEGIKNKYPPGTKVKGKVTNILDYGVFVEIEPGIEGFVHVSEMTWGRKQKSPFELVKTGDIVDVVVLNIDVEKQKMFLGMKQAKPDPWALIETKYPKGSIVKGVVIDFANFGAYVEIEDGVEGFLHVADISWTKRFLHPEEALRKGQKIKGVVVNYDRKNRLLEISMKDIQPNPWPEISKRLPPNHQLKAVVTGHMERGLTVEIDEGLEGFVPAGHLVKKGNLHENYPVGSEVNLAVLRVEPQRKRVLLSEKTYYEEKERQEIIRYKPEPARINLGELLRDELKRLKSLKEGIDEET